jgi:hypothetical protein
MTGPERKLMRGIGMKLAVVGVIVVVLVTGCGSSAKAPSPSRDIKGHIDIASAHIKYDDGSNQISTQSLPHTACEVVPGNGLDDIAQGASVVLTDETGKILASGQLDPGYSTMTRFTCELSFDLGQVPLTAKQYSVEVSHRGKITYSASKLASAGYVFSLSL